MDVVSSIVNASEEKPKEDAQTETPSSESPMENALANQETAAPKEDERLSSRFAALSKKERQLLEREQQLKAERAEYEEFKKAKENAKTDPLAYLEKSGLNLQDVIYSQLGSEKPEPTVEEKIKQLQERLEQKEKDEKLQKEKSETEQIETRINEFKGNIDKHIKDNAEKYELINLAGAQHEVYSLIEAWLDKTTKTGNPVLMSIDEAASKIEAYYEQHMDELMGKSKKLAGKYKPIQETPKPNPVSPTLTNKNSIAPSNSNPVENSGLSFEQRREASLKRSAQLLEELQRKR